MKDKQQFYRAFGQVMRSSLKLIFTLVILAGSAFQFTQPAAASAPNPTPPAPPARALPSQPHVPGPHVLPKRGAVAAPQISPPGAFLTYYGGPVISNMKSYEVNYGTGAYISSGTPATWIPVFTTQLLGSGLMDWLSEYDTTLAGGTNQLVGRGSYSSTINITPAAANNGAQITDAQIKAELSSQITGGFLPMPDSNTSYAVFFPATKTICLDNACTITSLNYFCAYHGSFLAPNNVIATYQVMPDLTGMLGCGTDTTLNNTTAVLGHELIETITDPQVDRAFVLAAPLAWYDIHYGEIADICNGITGSFKGTDGNTYVTELQFSNRSRDCILTRDFTISASPAALTIPANGTGATTISTGIISASALISLSVSGAPTGMSASLSSNPIIAGTSSTLSVSVGPSVAAGVYTLTVTGSESRVPTHSVNVTVTVPAPALSLTKTDTLNPGWYSSVGQVVTFTLTATNTGGVPLTNVTVSDSPALDNYSCTPAVPAASLAVGSAITCTGTHTITQADLDAGTYSDTASASSDQIAAPNAGDTITAAPRLIVIKHVVNNYGGTHTAGDFTLNVSGVTPSKTSFPGAEAPGTTVILGAGAYSVTEANLYGYQQASAVGCSGTIAAGQTITCTITNADLPGTLVIKKISDPVNSGSFAFTTSGAGYTGFNLPGGGQNSQTLSAGTYTVTESTQLGWILTGIGQDPVNPAAPMACAVTGSGGSSGTGDLTTQTATITIKNGDTVTCVFENTSQGVTRTQGFWATHSALANIAWFGGTAFGHTFPGVANTAGIGDITLCGRPIDTLGKLEGAFWSSISSTSTGVKRSQLDQQRMQLLQQLIAAELNASAFGSVPAGGSAMFAAWESAYCGTNQTAIKNAFTQSSTFDTAGDSQLFTPGTSADSKYGRSIANLSFWDVLP
ncbi:MAG TPA: hypothetical protein VF806_08380 [Anaerolineaceae bacterium]